MNFEGCPSQGQTTMDVLFQGTREDYTSSVARFPTVAPDMGPYLFPGS